ncbi:MAG TPA: glycosyltransferase family 4 protein [Polyangiales bacterium]|nr:glycosyltransferase family 4 protein [Polyangiales bacterium]
MSPLRIAAFMSHPIQYFSPLWRELSARPGVSLEVFYFSRQGLERSPDDGFGLSFAWDIDLLGGHRHRFLPRQWPTRDPLDWRATALNRGLVAAVDEGWDAVFVNGYTYFNNWTLAAACARRGIPLLCFGDTTLQTENARSPWKRAAKRFVFTQWLRRCGALLAAGGGTRAYFEHYGARPESIFICPYAVDVARFRRTVAEASAADLANLRARWGIPADKRIVMFCGKLIAWKRPFDVLHAVQELERRGIRDVVAVFVGDGELKQALRERGGPSVVTTGFVNQAEIPLALSLADVLVLSSEREPYGMVVSEAQCLGVPAVVSDQCGCQGPESVVQDRESGFVYPTGDVPALADRLARLLSDPELMARMRARARVQGDTQSQVAAADQFLAAVRHATGRHHEGTEPQTELTASGRP